MRLPVIERHRRRAVAIGGNLTTTWHAAKNASRMPSSHPVVRPPPPLFAVLSLVHFTPRKMSAYLLLPCASRSEHMGRLPINTVVGGVEVCLLFRGRIALLLPKRNCTGLVCHDAIYVPAACVRHPSYSEHTICSHVAFATAHPVC